jgi:hypothetical protein
MREMPQILWSVSYFAQTLKDGPKNLITKRFRGRILALLFF